MPATEDQKPSPRWFRAAAGAVYALLAALMLSAFGVWGTVGIGRAAECELVASLVGAAVGLTRRDRWLLISDVVLACAYFIVGLTPIMRGPMARWVRQDSLPITGVEAIVVLSSGLTSDSTLKPEGVDRLLAGLELAREGAAPRLVTTRVSDRGNPRVNSDADQRRLVQIAGVTSRWTILGPAATTRTEAERAAAVLIPEGVRSVAVVTSPAHTRRACGAFEAVGFVVYCVPARERDFIARRPVTPQDRLAAFRQYAYERLGTWKYKANGWIR